jgi:hypothetical protein
MGSPRLSAEHSVSGTRPSRCRGLGSLAELNGLITAADTRRDQTPYRSHMHTVGQAAARRGVTAPNTSAIATKPTKTGLQPPDEPFSHHHHQQHRRRHNRQDQRRTANGRVGWWVRRIGPQRKILDGLSLGRAHLHLLESEVVRLNAGTRLTCGGPMRVMGRRPSGHAIGGGRSLNLADGRDSPRLAVVRHDTR